MKGNNDTGSTKSTSSASAKDHDYNRSVSPKLTSLPISNPNTSDRPADKKHKSDITLADLQNNIAALINECSDSLEALISKNTEG